MNMYVKLSTGEMTDEELQKTYKSYLSNHYKGNKINISSNLDKNIWNMHEDKEFDKKLIPERQKNFYANFINKDNITQENNSQHKKSDNEFSDNNYTDNIN
jgi:hypothetical protein